MITHETILISSMSVSSLGKSLSRTIPPTPPPPTQDTLVLPMSKAVGKVKRFVSFGDVNIREHERIVGENPCVSSGPALELGWEYCDHSIPSQSVDEFEHIRTYVTPRLNKSELIVCRMERTKMLRHDFDISKADIASAIRSINRTKADRRQTLNNFGYYNLERVWEKTKRAGQRAMGLRQSTYTEIQNLWKNADKNLEKSIKRGKNIKRSESYQTDKSGSGSLSGRGNTKSMKEDKAENIRDKSKAAALGDSSSRRNRLFKKGKSSRKDVSADLDLSMEQSRHTKKYDLGFNDATTPTASNHGCVEKLSALDTSASGPDTYDECINIDDPIIKNQVEQQDRPACPSYRLKMFLQKDNSEDIDNQTQATESIGLSFLSRSSSSHKPRSNKKILGEKSSSIGIIAVEDDLFDAKMMSFEEDLCETVS
eukprot:scaffold10954_cov267-Chaetoceros_neogracile.AAC.6